jgi:D-alanyl-D-alanine dipeptidase
VYDSYRPQQAVDDFVEWSYNATDDLMKLEFYPTIDKSVLVPDYLADKSGHSKGSTVDLTLVKLPAAPQEQYVPGQQLVPCFANVNQRFGDNTIDMNTGFDCFSELSHTENIEAGTPQAENRAMLVALMKKRGFDNYPLECMFYFLSWSNHLSSPHPIVLLPSFLPPSYCIVSSPQLVSQAPLSSSLGWHFTLRNEPFPDTFFDFPVQLGCVGQSRQVCLCGLHLSFVLLPSSSLSLFLLPYPLFLLLLLLLLLPPSPFCSDSQLHIGFGRPVCRFVPLRRR